MPTYEYRCSDCQKRFSIFLSYEEYGRAPVHCTECDGENVARLISRVRVARSDEARFDSLSDPSAWDDIDENDPRSMARMMRAMGSEMGEDMPPEFDEVVDRLESGESPDEIEKTLPDLDGGGMFDE